MGDDGQGGLAAEQEEQAEQRSEAPQAHPHTQREPAQGPVPRVELR